MTPSQNMKNKSLGVQSCDGNCAIGNLKPESPRKTNWRTWDASWVSVFPNAQKRMSTTTLQLCMHDD